MSKKTPQTKNVWPFFKTRMAPVWKRKKNQFTPCSSASSCYSNYHGDEKNNNTEKNSPAYGFPTGFKGFANLAIPPSICVPFQSMIRFIELTKSLEKAQRLAVLLGLCATTIHRQSSFTRGIC
ncbi:hypothetical protein PVAND_003334 [Polypedilum vanderplanki]|uniref:Uncharacterized protein n=1 Tax=Polypedilum vanderplanki TaxID=319348 RepID=A0A9J6BU69_POLVA|nr:hypothetical protein PVAND_003334 [Polypedilum vanderplanki]